MTIKMRPGEAIRVAIPPSVEDYEVLAFLQTRTEWIKKVAQKFSTYPRPVPHRALPGEKWWFKGRQLVLTEAVTLLKKRFVVWGQDQVTLYWPESQWAAREELRPQALELIRESLRQEALSVILVRVQHYSDVMGLVPKKVKLMQAKTRWGSCTTRGYVNFNWRLIGAPESVVDSIIIHELAHLQQMNHSPRFWALVESYDPDRKQADQWLKEHQDELSS